MEKNSLTFTRSLKIKYILYAFFCFVCILVLRLFYLQIEKGGVFSQLGEKNFLRMEIIPPLRGDVYDCKQVLLAANRPVFDLYWHGAGQSRLSGHDESVLSKVFSILGMNASLAPKQNDINYAERYARRILLKEDVNFAQLCQISEQCPDAPRLVVANRFRRVYPLQELASHVLGYLNRSENVGKSGIELHFEDALQGHEGRLLHIINSTGKTLSKKVYQQAKAGADITLTLDAELQKLAESLFSPDQSGVFILMDPIDGAIRALVSYPQFDPNMFLSPLSEEKWGSMMMNNPLLNRATCALYPPASTFKMVTFAAGLEEGVIDLDSEIQCLGYTRFCGRKYFCMQHRGHGKLTPKQALAVSCNIPCYYIARNLKIDDIARYAQKFGLGKKTNFLLPEKEGLVPTTMWKLAARGERWWKGETLSASIGQGPLLVTPLQVARMVSSICTGYLVKPRLLDDEAIEKEPLDISHDTLMFLRYGMKEAVDDGSVRRLRYISDIEVYAKTGTAQTCGLEREKIYKHQLEHGWVAGYFSYKGQRPLTMTILLEHAESSRVAVQIGYQFLRGYKKIMENSGSKEQKGVCYET